MLKIHHFFVMQFLGLFVLMSVVASVVGYFTLKESVIDEYQIRLEREIAVMEYSLNGIENLQRYISEVAPLLNKRITIIDHNGTVVAESDTDPVEMENHAKREEVLEASQQRYGHAVRYSHTLGVDFLYVTKRVIWKGQIYTLRIAVNLQKVLDDFYTLLFRLIFAFFLLTPAILFLALRTSKRVRYDIKQLSIFLEEISDKNYKSVVKPRYFTEFLQISLLLKNLVKKLAKRERQKRKYTARLRLINRQRNDILSAISHEFKNPIASIVGYAETLHDDPEIEGMIRQRFLQKIMDNAQKISRMLDRLSLSVKLENNDLSPMQVTFDLCKLAQECVTNISKKYPERTVNVVCEQTLIEADRTMLDLVITNLLDNAMKYSEASIRLELNATHLWVKDRGIGIAEKEMDRISSKFYRVEKNTWDNSMGLGLSIVSYILTIHDTKLEIESSEGKGSAFGFSLENFVKERSVENGESEAAED